MKLLITIALLIFFTISHSTAQINFEGRLLTDEKIPVPDTQISVAGGTTDVTDSKGQFRIKLPLDFIEGERVILSVSKENWVINYPLDGVWNLPNIKYEHVQTIDIIIVPYGSKALWSHARIEKEIALLYDENIKLKTEIEVSKRVDINKYLIELAKKYDFTPQEVKEVFDEWAQSVKDTNDYRTLGLRAFYEQNFNVSAINFERAALQGEQMLKSIDKQKRNETLRIAENWRDAGIAYLILDRFIDALVKFKKADSLLSQDTFPTEWAEVQQLVGISSVAIGIRVGGKDSWTYLKRAVNAYRNVLLVCTRDRFAHKWAIAMNNLGHALTELANRSKPNESNKFIKEAIDTLSLVLQVGFREEFPYLWASAQINLGNALLVKGLITIKEESNQSFAEAVAAFQLALTVFRRDSIPQEWARTQSNLGHALGEQGLKTSGEAGNKLLNEAIHAFQLALEVRTRKQFPGEWAITQNKLGSVLMEQGLRSRGTKSQRLLQEAVNAFHSALQIFNRKNIPRKWALTQNNLGYVLFHLGLRSSGKENKQLFRWAIDSYHLALEVRTRDFSPQDWATTQYNLGCALFELGRRTFFSGIEEGNQYLREAITALRLALEIRTRENLPQRWAETQIVLASTLQKLGNRTTGEEREKLLKEADEAFYEYQTFKP